jgi:hypothetical protein
MSANEPARAIEASDDARCDIRLSSFAVIRAIRGEKNARRASA